MKLLRNALLLAFPLALLAPVSAQTDDELIDAMIREGAENSHVMDTLRYLSEEIGPRLTGSERLDRANAWTRDEFARLGLENAHLHKWGEVPVRFDRGPSRARLLEPEERDLEFTTMSWGAGTNGPVRAKVVRMPKSPEDLDAVADDLDGAWLLAERPPRRSRRGETDEQRAERERAEEARALIDAALAEYDVAGKIYSSGSELIVTSSVRNWRELTMDTLPETVEVFVKQSDFDFMGSKIDAGELVLFEADLVHHFSEGPFPQFNTVAEIVGSEKPDEVIILSGHLDTWDGPGSEGAQDNGTGCAVMMEAARILMAVGAQPKRTIRFCLWGGEEQGLLGSRGYVDSLSEEERAKISAVFVDDGGTNYQGGLTCVPPMAELLERAVDPVRAAFPDLPIEVSVQERMPRGGGSDHMSFNAVDVPAFYWREVGIGGLEGKDYNFIHHTQHDTMRYVIEEYLVQSAVCSAVTAFSLAQADDILPRASSYTPPAEEEDTTPFEAMASPLTGAWSIAVTDEDAPPITFDLTLDTGKDGALRGTYTGRSGEQRIKKGSWKSDGAPSAAFEIDSDFGTHAIKVSFEDGGLKGTFGAMGRDIAIAGTKASAAVEASSPIAGDWKGIITSMDADIWMTFAVDASGVVTGRFKSSQSDSEIFDGKWDADAQTLSFSYDYPHAGKLPVTAKLQGGELVGVIGENAEFVAKRTGGAPTPVEASLRSGTWRGYIAAMDAEFTLKLQLAEDGAVTGRYKSSQSDSELFDGTWDETAKELKFQYDYPHAGRLPVFAKLEDGRLVGVIGEKTEFEAELKADE